MTVHDYQVLQRDDNGMAHGLPVGGPYDVDGAKNVLVGDLWILAGQSNMEGCGDLIGVDLEAPSPFVHTYQSKEEWALAEEPLHRLDETPQLVHHVLAGRDSVPDEIPPRDMGRTKGSGLGLAFAKHLYHKTSIPIGFIPSAHGGTSMQQWDPSLAREGSLSLYGATLARVKAVGGRVAGILWYQGESDANPMDMCVYQERMTRLVQAFREDLGQPDLPFYYVQLGRFAVGPEPSMLDGWNGVREAQRTWEATLPRTEMVSAIDLDLDDAIHIGTSGLKRLGRRLADAAAGTPAPQLRSAAFEADASRLRVTFDNVRGELSAHGRPSGFSLRHADGTEFFTIFKITLEGDSAILHCDAGQALPAGVQLWYGWGLDPYCNITDAQDASIPAFGPIQLL